MYLFQLFLMLSHWAYRYLIRRCKQKTDDEEEQEEQEEATTTVAMLKFKGTPPRLDSFLEDKPKNSQLKSLYKRAFLQVSAISAAASASATTSFQAFTFQTLLG
jgi:hypothetical protein